MPIHPTAEFDELNGPGGPYLGGPFKIVHHTTEGDAYPRGTYLANGSEPHFTVEGARIIQHIDTSRSARSLENHPGGVQTNRDGAIQIEVVGHAARPKGLVTLQTVASLCRWIEEQHGVPRVWPNGLPRVARNGGDPGGHNRNAANWETRGGHYGHSQVPENIHWDPGYTRAEVELIMGQVPVRVLLNGAEFPEADGHTDFRGTSWGRGRPLGEALGYRVESPSRTAVEFSRDGTSILFQAERSDDGRAYIRLRDLGRLPGVRVEWDATNRLVRVQTS